MSNSRFGVIVRGCFVAALFAWALLLGLWVSTDAHGPEAPDLPLASATVAEGEVSQSDVGILSGVLGEYQSEFHFTEMAGGYLLANRPQGFDAILDRHGFQVDTNGVHWGLKLAAYGYRSKLITPAEPTVLAQANRVEMLRGGLAEWYVNGPFGLEQGFTLYAAPAGRQGNDPLLLELSQIGDKGAATLEDGQNLRVNLPGNAGLLHYGGLFAYDAGGMMLPAEFDLSKNGTIYIKVQDYGAQYPITIDPLIQHTKLTVPGTPTDLTYMGDSVAMDDEVVVVGVPGYNGDVGAVFVFTRTVGSWQVSTTPAAILTASDGAVGDELGYSVALDGSRIVAGAPYHNGNAGAAYVFERPGGGWVTGTQTSKLTATAGAADDYFGDMVDLSGNLIVVGAYGFDSTSPVAADAGAAYVFTYAGSWSQTARLVSENVQVGGGFGSAVAVDSINNVVVIGAPFETVDLTVAAGGKAYVFVNGNYVDAVELESLQPTAAAWLGYAVAIEGSTILVGAPQDNQTIGATLVFTRPAVNTIEELYNVATLTPSDGASGDNFGSSVKLTTSYAIVGSPTATGPGAVRSGAAYVFARPVSQWADSTETAKLIPSDGQANDDFGDSVDLAGTSFVVGAPLNDAGANDTGAAYVFTFDDLAITKTSNVATALPGERITYTLAYVNNGPNAVSAAVIWDNLPISLTGTAYVSEGLAVTATPGSRYTWELAPIPAFASGVITVSGVFSTPLAGGQIVNTAIISSPLPDRNTANNTSQVTVTVPLNADLSIQKSAVPSRLTAGARITFTLVYSSAGPDSLTGVVITDIVPVSVTNIISTSSGPTLSPVSGAAYAWAVQGTLAPNVTGVITVVGTLSGTLTQPEQFTNTAVIAAPHPDVVSTNNSSSTPVSVCMNNLSVTTQNDSGVGSLRWAMDGICPGGTITIQPAAPSTISLTTGELIAAHSMTLNAAGPATVTVDAAGASRVFDIGSGAIVTINGMRIHRGTVGAGEHGGGVRVNAGASLTLSNTIISSSSAGTGGALANFGVTAIQNSTLTGNSATNGGAIGNAVGMTLTISGSAIVTNTATGTVLAGFGGGLLNSGAVTLENVTFARNQAAQGGAIYQASAQGALNIRSTTVATNTATTTGGGVYGVAGSATLLNSIFANNGTGTGSNVGGAVSYTNSGGNVCWPSGTCTSSPAIPASDPLLGLLGYYLGATPTLPLLPGSSAINAVSSSCPAIDQRGISRPQGASCDAGAYEARPFTLSLTSGSGQSTPAGSAFAAGMRVAVAGTAPDPVNGGVVTYAGPLSGASTNPVTNTATVVAGSAVVTPTANDTLGAYSVAASARGATAPVSFLLTNTDAPIAGLQAANSSPTILGSSTFFTATKTAGTNVTYSWNFGDNTPAGAGATPSHQYSAIGVYTAIVTATNNLSSTSTTTQVTIKDIPISGLQASNDGPKPEGQLFSFSASVTAGTGVSYAWSFGDSGTGTGASPTHVYASAGTYTAIVTATNTSGQTTAQTIVTVQGLVTLSVSTNGNGTVTKAPDQTEFVLGTSAVLTANPGAGMRFTGWSGDASGSDNPLTVLMDNDKSIVANFVAASAPQAVNDGAATRQEEQTSGNVLANDTDPNPSQLTVSASTQPAHGSATVAPDGTFVYTPAADFTGIDSFGYTARNSYGLTDDATVYVVVEATASTAGQPVAVVGDINQAVTQNITAGGLTHTLEIPAGAYEGTLLPSDVFFVVYTPLPNGPETEKPPFGFVFGGKSFRLDAYLNGTRLTNPTFNPPLKLTLHYDANALEDLDPALLVLLYWNETRKAWLDDGIQVVNRDLPNGLITFSLSHLSEFGYFQTIIDNFVNLPFIRATFENVLNLPLVGK